MNEPAVVSALREQTNKQLGRFSADSAVMGRTQGAVGLQGKVSCDNRRKVVRKASQGDNMEGLQEC